MQQLNRYILVSLLVLAFANIRAQQLVLSGTVFFEKKENLHKLYKDGDRWAEEMKKRSPKYRTDIFQLTFNNKQSLYKLLQEDETQMNSWSGKVAGANTVLSDFTTGKSVSEKAVYEMDYRVEDSFPAYKWKILGEYREIAGFNCKKAAAIINDSLYVIAFYTDQIPVSAGPESFRGLPGMILGVVVPRLNITYFATRVDRVAPGPEAFTYRPKKKAKQVNNKAFLEELIGAVKNWGEYAPRVYFKALL